MMILFISINTCMTKTNRAKQKYSIFMVSSYEVIYANQSILFILYLAKSLVHTKINKTSVYIKQMGLKLFVDIVNNGNLEQIFRNEHCTFKTGPRD